MSTRNFFKIGGTVEKRSLTYVANGADNLKEYVGRKLGLGKKQYQWMKYNEALQHPGVYLQRKREDLQRVIDAAATVYEDELKKFLEMGYDGDAADKQALQYAAAEKNRQMKRHEREFPTQYEKVAIRRLGKLAGDGKGKAEEVIEDDK